MFFLPSLTACTPQQVVRTEYIEAALPESPAAPAYYPVRWKKLGELYCTDVDGAKALLKNRALDESWQQEVLTIFQNLKGSK